MQPGEERSPDFDYTTLNDEDAEFGRAEVVKEKGFCILPSRNAHSTMRNCRPIQLFRNT